MTTGRINQVGTSPPSKVLLPDKAPADNTQLSRAIHQKSKQTQHHIFRGIQVLNSQAKISTLEVVVGTAEKDQPAAADHPPEAALQECRGLTR